MSNEKIAAGVYKGHAVSGTQQYAVNASNGNEQIALSLHIPALNRTVDTVLHFSDKAAPYAIERLRACGWQGDDISNLAGIDGNEIDVSVRYETYEGKERMKVDIMTGGGRIKLDNQMDEKAKRAFAARMKSLLTGTNGAAKPMRARAPSAPADVRPSDIPF